MTATFAAAAGRLAGVTALALGWRPHEFWAATPAELAMILAAQVDAAPPPLSGAQLTELLERDRDG